MSALLKELFFDRKMVSKIREAKPDKNRLYNYVSSGKITLQEYLSIEKNLK